MPRATGCRLGGPHRWPPGLCRHGPRRLPRLRAPDRARARRPGRARAAADARRPRARHHPQARLRAREAVPRRPRGRRAGRRSRSTPDGSIEDRGEQLRAAAAATIEAMASGADVIYQATFFDGTWRGHADFLLRVDDPARPSVWGPWHYEVADTKLARHVKASAVLQICSYIDQLERIQGVRPEWMYVALGGSARAVERLARRRLHGLLPRRAATGSSRRCPTRRRSPTRPSAPIPSRSTTATSAAGPPNAPRAGAGDDHLSLVAGISGAPAPRARRARRSTTLEASRRPAPADRPAARGHRRGRAGARPRAGPDPARGPACRDRPLYELLLPEPGRAARAGTRARDAAAALARRPLLRHRGRPVRARRRARLPLRRPRHGRHVPRHLVARRRRRVHPRRRARGVRAAHGLLRGAARADPDAAHLPLRAIRADRAQAADGPLRHARGRGRSTCSAAASSSTSCGPSASRSARRSRATRSRRWRRSTGSPARSTCATRARASSRSSSGWSSARASGPAADHLERIERYNRDDVVSNLRAPRLAGGAARSSWPR